MDKVRLFTFSFLTLVAGKALVGVSGAPRGQSSAFSSEAALARARQAATAFTQSLQKELLAALKLSGPKGAIKACSVKASELARTYSRDGVTVRRVTLAARNPANLPDSFEGGYLSMMATKARAGEKVSEVWEVVSVGEKATLRYLRPIFVVGLCVQCHGPRSTLQPEVAQLLSQLYPHDQALGYKIGDFRGAVSVTVGLGSIEPAKP